MGFTGGVLFTFTIALLGMGLTKFPVFDRFGAMVSAILLAVAYRQVAGYPEQLRTGVAFSAKKLLRYAIVLYGFKLNVDVILHRGLPLLLRDAGTIVLALGLTMLIAKWLKADKSLSLLLGVGTGVCGDQLDGNVFEGSSRHRERTHLHRHVLTGQRHGRAWAEREFCVFKTPSCKTPVGDVLDLHRVVAGHVLYSSLI